MRCGWLAVVTLFVVGCGVNRPSNGTWPASIVRLQNFSSSEQVQVISEVQALNAALGKQALSLDLGDSHPTGYPITLVKVSMPPTDGSRAGYASVEDTQCTVQLNTALFDSSHSSDFKSVLWHELGHCAGLTHVATNEEIMSPVALGFSQYTQQALTRFYTSFLSSAGL